MDHKTSSNFPLNHGGGGGGGCQPWKTAQRGWDSCQYCQKYVLCNFSSLSVAKFGISYKVIGGILQGNTTPTFWQAKKKKDMLPISKIGIVSPIFQFVGGGGDTSPSPLPSQFPSMHKISLIAKWCHNSIKS